LKLSSVKFRDAVAVKGHNATMPYFTSDQVDIQLQREPFPVVVLQCKSKERPPVRVPISNVIAYETAEEAAGDQAKPTQQQGGKGK